MNAMLAIGQKGIEELIAHQKKCLED